MLRKKQNFGGEGKINPGDPEKEIRRLQEIPLYHDTYFKMRQTFVNRSILIPDKKGVLNIYIIVAINLNGNTFQVILNNLNNLNETKNINFKHLLEKICSLRYSFNIGRLKILDQSLYNMVSSYKHIKGKYITFDEKNKYLVLDIKLDYNNSNNSLIYLATNRGRIISKTYLEIHQGFALGKIKLSNF